MRVYPNGYKKKINDKSFFREQFWKGLMFWNEFFEGAIYLQFMVAD